MPVTVLLQPPPMTPRNDETLLGSPETPPPAITPPLAPVVVLTALPPSRLGVVTSGSRRSARAPLTLISSATLSVVPTKLVPAVVPALPVSAQPDDGAGATQLALPLTLEVSTLPAPAPLASVNPPTVSAPVTPTAPPKVLAAVNSFAAPRRGTIAVSKAIVPIVSIVPPVRPAPAVIDVTVPPESVSVSVPQTSAPRSVKPTTFSVSKHDAPANEIAKVVPSSARPAPAS